MSQKKRFRVFSVGDGQVPHSRGGARASQNNFHQNHGLVLFLFYLKRCKLSRHTRKRQVANTRRACPCQPHYTRTSRSSNISRGRWLEFAEGVILAEKVRSEVTAASTRPPFDLSAKQHGSYLAPWLQTWYFVTSPPVLYGSLSTNCWASSGLENRRTAPSHGSKKAPPERKKR